jgi:hypothetical protein
MLTVAHLLRPDEPIVAVDPSQFRQANNQEGFCQSDCSDAYGHVSEEDSVMKGKFSTNCDSFNTEYCKENDATVPVDPRQFGQPRYQGDSGQPAEPIQQWEDAHEGRSLVVITIYDLPIPGH